MKIFLNNPINQDFNFLDHKISYINYKKYLKYNKTIFNYLKYGISGNNLFAKLLNPSFLQDLYINKDKNYFKFLNEFKERFKDYDIIVMNPGIDLVHPEFLHKHFKNSIKVLSFIDDPHQTYNYGLAYSWVFDAATYVSPTYSVDLNMRQILSLAGFKDIMWYPNCLTNTDNPKWGVGEIAQQLEKRINKSFYVGGYYTDKIKRLAILKKKLNTKFDIFGYYPLKGLSFFVGNLLLNKIPIFYLPRKLNKQEWNEVYESYGVGINMHLSDPSIEFGNIRLYELGYRGVAQVCDVSSVTKDIVKKIFIPDKEILLYETADQCVEQVNRLLSNKNLRIEIALAAYKRSISEYKYEITLKKKIKWFKTLLKKKFNTNEKF
jgi:spore maturation protein CgeB